jgi:hypothetical protein
MYSFTGNKGDIVNIDATELRANYGIGGPGSESSWVNLAPSYVRLFYNDGSGIKELAHSNTIARTPDPEPPSFPGTVTVYEGAWTFADLHAISLPATGTYYIGVTASTDTNYDPTVRHIGPPQIDTNEFSTGDETGSYILTVERLSPSVESITQPTVYPGADVGDGIAGALTLNVGVNQRVNVDEILGDNFSKLLFDDVDMYRVSGSKGDDFTIQTSSVAGPPRFEPGGDFALKEMPTYLRVFDSLDNQVADGEGTVSFQLPADGTYYIGVSSTTNPDYNPATGDSGIMHGSGSAGYYRLTVERSASASAVSMLSGSAATSSSDSTSTTSIDSLLSTADFVPPAIDNPLYLAFVNQANGSVLRTKSDAAGNFSVFLAPNATYDVLAYDPVSEATNAVQVRTGPSGTPLQVPAFLFPPIYMPDTTGDGLPDPVTFTILGITPLQLATTLHGVNIGAELQEGLDPLAGIVFPTGVVAALPLEGQAEQVVLNGSTLNAQQQTAYVATGTYGLAVVDASQFTQPLVLGQVQLPEGNATSVSVDPNLSIAAVADGSGGLDMVDVSDPTQPKLLQSIAADATQVVAVDGIAYAAVATQLMSYDMLTGDRLQILSLGGGTITGLARDGSFLYTMDSNNTLHVIDISAPQMVVRGSVSVASGATLASGSGALFVGDGVAYIGVTRFLNTSGLGALSGYITVDVSNPDAPKALSGEPSSDAAGQAVAVNGSGTALTVGSDLNGPAIDLFDSSDPTNVSQFLTRFSLPAAANDVAIGAGIAFVANGSSGLQVVNYLPFDTTGIPPTINLDTSNLTPDPTLGGFDAVEGSLLTLNATVSSNVQVRNVELLVNGQVVQNDVSFPFDLSTYLPAIATAGTSVIVQLSATDTGGNTTITNPITINLVPDTTPPTIVQQNPPNGGTVGQEFRALTIDFSKSLDPITISAADFEVDGPSGTTVTAQDVELRLHNTEVQVTLPAGLLPAGEYTLVIHAAMITDTVGNALGSADITTMFHVAQYTEVWTNPNGGSWSDPSNWDTGRVPQAGDDVYINEPGNPTITFDSSAGAVEIRNLLSEDPFQITGGTLTVSSTVEVDNAFTIGGGTLAGATVNPGSGGQGITFTSSGGMLDGVTSNTFIDLAFIAGAYAHVRDGLTLGDGAVIYMGYEDLTDEGNSGKLYFDNTETIGGTGTVCFGAFSSSTIYAAGTSNATLTIGPGITLHGASGTLTDFHTGTIINQGKITADNSPFPGQFSYDNSFTGGTAHTYNVAIDTSGAGSEAAPPNTYVSDREGTFSYTLSGLAPGASYDVRLHFAEDNYNGANQHEINASLNGTSVLTNFDIFAAAGGKGKAFAEDFTATADANGNITAAFSGVANFGNYGQVNGIQVLSGTTTVLAIDCGLLNDGGGISINPTTFTNQGTLSAANGDGLSISNLTAPMKGVITAGATGTITVSGALTIDPTGTVNIDLGGTGAGQFGEINVTGAATLAGTLNVSLVNGYQPVSGDSIKIMTFASETGQFGTVNGTDISTNLVLAPVYDTGDLTLVAGAPQLAEVGAAAGDAATAHRSVPATLLTPLAQTSSAGSGSDAATAQRSVPATLLTPLAQTSSAGSGSDAATAHRSVPATLLSASPQPAERHGTREAQVPASSQSIEQAAIDAWAAAGLDPRLITLLKSVDISVEHLGNDVLALTAGNRIILSDDADGYGWLLYSGSTQGFDLVTVLEHEFGHILGLPDQPGGNDLMAKYLAPGVRRTPSPEDVDAVFAEA